MNTALEHVPAALQRKAALPKQPPWAAGIEERGHGTSTTHPKLEPTNYHYSRQPGASDVNGTLSVLDPMNQALASFHKTLTPSTSTFVCANFVIGYEFVINSTTLKPLHIEGTDCGLSVGLYTDESWNEQIGSASTDTQVMGPTGPLAELRETRQALIRLVRRFADVGLSWAAGQSAKITVITQLTAQRFLLALPAGKALPKISPDGEGGLVMVWEGATGPLLLTIDDFHLHAVIGATTRQAEYIDDVPFGPGRNIPQRILDSIPVH